MLLAALLGFAGGYLLHTDAHPTATASVRFDGVHAFYAGPAELKAGTALTITARSTVPGASVVVSRLDPAPSYEQLLRDVATANTSAAVMPLSYVHHVATLTTDHARAVVLHDTGVYSIWVGPVTGPAAGPSVAVAAVVRVSG